MNPAEMMAQNPDDEQEQLRRAMLIANSVGGQQPTISGPPPPPPSTMDTTTIADLPTPKADPDVTLAHATYESQPGAADSRQAQSNLDAYQNRPMWKKMLGPGLIAAASTLGAHSWGGRQLQEQGSQDIQNLNNSSQAHYQSLVQQLEQARTMQQQQYEADQRNRQQDIMLAGQNQEKTLLGQIAAGSRLGVADTAAKSRESVAGTNAGSREAVADTNATSREAVANTGANARVKSAQINADAALKRFLAGQDRVDARQQAGFGHTDNKPTADEERRADLSEAMVGYAQMLQDIAKRRPELFGPLAGRITQGRQMLGTTDEDVASLKMLKEQLGITQMGAHSLRSAQAIAPIADSLVNGFHNDAATTVAVTNNAIKGIEQFINGPERPVVYGPGQNKRNAVGGPTPLTNKVSAPPRPAGVPADAQWNPTGNGGKGSWVK